MTPTKRLWLSIVLLAIILAAGASLYCNYLPSGGPPSSSTSSPPNSFVQPFHSSYSLVEENFYMGGRIQEPPPGTRAVLNLCEHEDVFTTEVQQWSKIPDAAPAPSIDWLRKQVEFIDKQCKAGLTTYVHCFAGVSRAWLVVTAYEMHKNGWTRDQALEFVRSKRSIINPNPAFRELLLEWEKELKKK